MKVAVAGGGIGGLVLALSLGELDLEVDVYEAVDEIRPLGVGINLLPHAVRELAELALLPKLEQAGILTAELAYYSKHGQHIWSEPRGLAAGYRFPQVSIHRGRLHRMLFDTVRERLGETRVHLGHALAGFRQDAAGVELEFVHRTTGRARAHADADILIGADGVHSRVRALLHPNEGDPHWNGALLWRGVTMSPPFLTGRSMIMAGHAAQKFVAYPIGEGNDGLRETNWIAELRFEQRALLPREDWNAHGELDDFLPQFRSFRFDWLDVPQLIAEAELVCVYPLIDRDPLPFWSRERVTLLGDAAHPMYPVGSNGASQAILDARVLTGCLRDIADPRAALQRYEAVRRPVTSALTLANRGQGPEECMTLVEQRAPAGFERLDDVISRQELVTISDKYKRLAGFSVAELNARPSLAALRYEP